MSDLATLQHDPFGATDATESADVFVDRRNYTGGRPSPGVERRQFTNSHEGLSPPARELALAVDEFKLSRRRRFITYEEMYEVIASLGYRKA